MNRIAVSMRLYKNNATNEWRDCLALDWAKFLHQQGVGVQCVPNDPKHCRQYLGNVDALILTGGDNIILNSPSDRSDDPMAIRDETEYKLLEVAIEKNIPVLGVCRGMQLINNYFGGTLKTIEGHVAADHNVTIDGKSMTVNSFHDLTIDQLGQNLKTLATTDEETIEAFEHTKKRITGIMWHPERPCSDEQTQRINTKLIQQLLGHES